MSVVFFGSDELAGVLAFVAARQHIEDKAEISAFAGELAAFSAANRRAYVASYRHAVGDGVSVVTKATILRAFAHRAPNTESAFGCIRLMRYNLRDQAGRDHGTAKVNALICDLLLEIVRWHEDRVRFNARMVGT